MFGLVCAVQGEVNGQGLQNQNQIQAGDYETEIGEQFQIQERENNRVRLKTNNVTADCDCELEQEQVQNRTRLKMKLSNGKYSEIKIMPDTASETALARLRLKVCSAENNCTIQLKEVGLSNATKQSAYEIQAQRHFRVLGLFQTKAQVKAQIDAETGEIIQVKKPWWSFLATEQE